MMPWTSLNYVGSFQDRRRIVRTGDQLAAVWLEVERVGTKDSLERIAKVTGEDVEQARIGSLRIKQAVELHHASKGTSQLTRPLLLYYSCLNLVRGWLTVQRNGMGEPRHGATFKSGANLLDCGAKIDKNGEGTLPRLLQVLNGQDPKSFAGKEISLRDCLSQIPELIRDFMSIPNAVSSLAFVQIKALINGPTSLRYHIADCSEADFAAHWQELLPWMQDECQLSDEGPFILKLKSEGLSPQQVTEFCERRLMSQLHLNDDPTWFDQVQHKNKYLLPGRLTPYMFALFILSNVCRYEPQLFGELFKESSDLGLAITNFLGCAERYVPHLFINIAHGATVFFE